MSEEENVRLTYAKFCRDLDAKQMAYFERKGVHPDALGFHERRKLYGVKTAPILLDGGGLFFTFANGESDVNACIFVCRDERGDVVDMAAWMPKDGTVRLWNNMVSMLGEEVISAPRVGDDKLWVRESVMDWLVHRRTGVVIVNYDAARPMLTAASPIAVRSKAHKARLEEKWRAPRINVVEAGVAESVTEAA